jgi:hypothetical protein
MILFSTLSFLFTRYLTSFSSTTSVYWNVNWTNPYTKEIHSVREFACEILVICQTALLQTSHILHTELSLAMFRGSHYVQWSSCNHIVNMSAPLSDCTILEQHAIIWFSVVKDSYKNVSTIWRKLLCKGRCTNGWKYSKVPEQALLMETTWAIWPHFTNDSVEWVDALVHEDRQITVTDIANKLDISFWSSYSIIHEDLRFHRICARWVPTQLTNEHRWTCVEMCMQSLQWCQKEKAFLQWIVTGNEMWVHHYEPASKCQSVEWKHIIPLVQEIQMCLLPAKWCFGTLMGPSSNTTRIMDRWSVVHHIVLCLKSWNLLFAVNAEECRRIELFSLWQHLTSYSGSIHWNDSKTEIQASPPPSLQSRCHPTWLALKDALHGNQFAYDEVNDIVHMWHHTQLKALSADGIRKLMGQSNKCVEKLREYVQKWHFFLFAFS